MSAKMREKRKFMVLDEDSMRTASIIGQVMQMRMKKLF